MDMEGKRKSELWEASTERGRLCKEWGWGWGRLEGVVLDNRVDMGDANLEFRERSGNLRK